MPGRRGAHGPGAIGRGGPRHQQPGMKPGHRGRPGMKPGRPEGAFMVAPHHHGVFIEVCPPLLIVPPQPSQPPAQGLQAELHGHKGPDPVPWGVLGSPSLVLGRTPLHLRLLGPRPPVLGTAPTGRRALRPRRCRIWPEAAPGRWGLNPPPGNSTVTGGLPVPWGVDGSPPHRSWGPAPDREVLGTGSNPPPCSPTGAPAGQRHSRPQRLGRTPTG